MNVFEVRIKSNHVYAHNNLIIRKRNQTNQAKLERNTLIIQL